jgi:hypothetical protein
VFTNTNLSTTAPFTVYIVDVSSSSISISLNSNPIEGEIVGFCDFKGSLPSSPTGFGLSALSITSTSHLIQSLNTLVLDEDNMAVTLVFYNNRWTIAQATLSN